MSVGNDRQHQGCEETADDKADSLSLLSPVHKGRATRCRHVAYAAEYQHAQIDVNLMGEKALVNFVVAIDNSFLEMIPFLFQLEEQMSQRATRHDSEGYALGDVRDHESSLLVCGWLRVVICHGGVFLF